MLKLLHKNSKKKPKEKQEQKELAAHETKDLKDKLETEDLKDKLTKTTEQLNILRKLWKDRETQFEALQKEANNLKQQNTILQTKQIKHDVTVTKLETQLSDSLKERTKLAKELHNLQQISQKEKKILINEIKKLRNVKSTLLNKYESEKNTKDTLQQQYEQKEYEQKINNQKLQKTKLAEQIKHEQEMKLLAEKYEELNEQFSEAKQNQANFGSISYLGVWKDQKQRAMSNSFGRADCVETPVLLLREELLKQNLSTGYIGIQDGNEIWYDFDGSTWKQYGQISEQRARREQNIHVVGFKGVIDVIGNGWMNAVYRVDIVLETPEGGTVKVVNKLNKRMKYDSLERTRVRLKNKKWGKYIVCKESGKVKCNKSKRSDEGVFEMIPLERNVVGIKSVYGAFLSVGENGVLEGLYGQGNKVFVSQKFSVIETEGLYYGFQSVKNGKYVCGRKDGDVIADKEWCRGWESFVVELFVD